MVRLQVLLEWRARDRSCADFAMDEIYGKRIFPPRRDFFGVPQIFLNSTGSSTGFLFRGEDLSWLVTAMGLYKPRGCIGRHQGCIGRPRRCIERVRGCIGRRVFTCACRVQWQSFETNLGVYFHHGLVFSWWRPAARNSKYHNPAHIIANLLHSPVMMFGSGQFFLLQNFACAPDTFCAHKT